MTMRARVWAVLTVFGLLWWAAIPIGSAAATPPGLTVGPSPATVGAQLDATGQGFGATEAVDLFLATSDLAMVVTDASGSFSTTLTVPNDALPGETWVSALGRRSGALARERIVVLGTAMWTQHGYDGARTSWNPDERVLRASTIEDLVPRWSTRLAEYGWIEDAVMSTNTIYVRSDEMPAPDAWEETDHSVRAVDVTTGETRWERSFGRSGLVGPVLADGTLVVGVHVAGRADLHGLDPASGADRWSVTIASGKGSSLGELVVDDSTAVVGVADTGADHRSTPWLRAVDIRDGSLMWEVEAADWIHALAAGSGIVVAAHGNGYAAYDLATGSRSWSVSRRDSWGSYTVALAHGLVIGSIPTGTDEWAPPDVVALDPNDGHIVWSVSWKDEWLWLTGIAGRGDTLLLTSSYWESSSGKLWSIDPANGDVRWTERGSFWGGIVAGGNVAYTAGGYGMSVFNATTGTKLLSVDNVGSVFALANGTVLALDNSEDRAPSLIAFQLPTPPAPKRGALVPDAALEPDRHIEAHTAMHDGWTALPVDAPTGDLRVVGTTTFNGETYVGTEGENGGGLFVVRDGRLVRIAPPGFGDPNTTSLTPLAVGRTLWVIGGNASDGMTLFASTDATTFDAVADRGLGDADNVDALPMEVAGDLVLGVTNPRTGAQLWRIQPGTPPTVAKVTGVPTERLDAFTAPVTFDGTTYIGMTGAKDPMLLRTGDGVSWQEMRIPAPASTTSVTPQAVPGDTMYVVAGSPRGLTLLATEDGDTYRVTGPTQRLPQDAAIAGQLVTFGDTLYLVGSSLDPRVAPMKGTLEVAPEQPFRMWSSTDGATWTRVNGDAFGDPHDVSATALVAGDVMFLAVTNYEEGDSLFRTDDGSTWTTVFSQASRSHASTGLVPFVANDRLVLADGNATKGMTVWQSDEVVAAGGDTPWVWPALLVLLATGGAAVALLLRRRRPGPPPPTEPVPPRHAQLHTREVAHV